MIRLYRLSSGEDVIGTPQESDKAFHVALKKPFVLIPMQGQPGKPMQIGFHPYIPYTKDEVIHIKDLTEFVFLTASRIFNVPIVLTV